MKIAVLGKMRSGKDTLSKYFIDNDDAVQVAFGDEIKKLAKVLYPELVAEGKNRRLYQELGQKLREIDPNVWVNQLDNRLEFLESLDIDSFVVSDVRQMNEYEYLKAKGFTVVKVETADELRIERIARAGDVFREQDFYHETETCIDQIPYDYLVTNNDTLFSFLDQIEFIHQELQEVRKT